MSVMLGGMSAVELPAEPSFITLADVEAIKLIRQTHERELEEFENETRAQRKNLRKLKLAQKKEVDNLPDRSQQLAEEQAKKAALEAAEELAKMLASEAEREAELEKVALETILAEKSYIAEKLRKLREQRHLAETWAAEGNGSDHDSDNSDCEAVRPPCAVVVGVVCAAQSSGQELFSSVSSTAVPSGAPSAASSAAASRSNSPSGSDAGARCPPVAFAAVAAAVERAECSDSAAAGKGVAATAVAATAAAAPAATPRKGGKGKGKGSAPTPPPKGSCTPRQSIAERAAIKPSKFVNLYWKATQKPETIEPDAFENDPFLAKIYAPDRGKPPEHVLQNMHPKICIPALPETIFSAGIEVREMPEEMLEMYFKRCEAAVRMPQADSSKGNQGTGSRTNFLGDQKRLNMIGIMLQKHIMKHKEESNREAILNIKRGILQCNFDVVKLESLSVIRTVLRQHVNDNSPLQAYVHTHGEAAIWDLAYPEHHYLVHELSKVPQIDQRLECMLFQLSFCENMETSKNNLATLLKGLEALKAKRDLIRRFFVTAHRLGQSLSQKQSRGFQLSTLEKLTQTKSTKLPHLSILHFVLALMSPADAQDLFTDDDIALLRGAKALGTAKVGDECKELALGLYGVKQICDSGHYTVQSIAHPVKMERRRKTLDPRAAAAALAGEPQEPAIDTDDCFHEVMQKFVQSHIEEADDNVVECHKMLLLYKELALFFDDLGNVWPPPKDQTDQRLDLVDVFYRFAKLVPQHRQQVEEEALRQKM